MTTPTHPADVKDDSINDYRTPMGARCENCKRSFDRAMLAENGACTRCLVDGYTPIKIRRQQAADALAEAVRKALEASGMFEDPEYGPKDRDIDGGHALRLAELLAAYDALHAKPAPPDTTAPNPPGVYRVVGPDGKMKTVDTRK